MIFFNVCQIKNNFTKIPIDINLIGSEEEKKIVAWNAIQTK